VAGPGPKLAGPGTGRGKVATSLSAPPGPPRAVHIRMTLARQVIPKQTHLVTRRCTQRQMLLRPEPAVDQIFEYCLGVAAERYGITLHAFVVMSNHEHLVVRDNAGNFPEFLAYHHKLVAKAMNRHRKRRENFWAAEQPNAVRLVEANDRFDKLVYLLANPVAGDLVDRVTDWPGATSFPLHLSGRSKVVKRPRVFFRAKGTMPTEVTLRLERPDGFDELTEDEWIEKLRAAVHAAETRARRVRRESGKGILGRKAILRARPTDVPKQQERRSTLRPCIACRNRELRALLLDALRAFRAARREAAAQMLAGVGGVLFPYGTYRVRGFFTTKPPPRALA
jgi:putative transposase